jgi:hypothetical protein
MSLRLLCTGFVLLFLRACGGREGDAGSAGGSPGVPTAPAATTPPTGAALICERTPIADSGYSFRDDSFFVTAYAKSRSGRRTISR